MAVDFEHPKLRIRITDLDDNLVIEILSHLPYQCVMVSKTVCKLWNSLISTPYFVRRFLRHRLQITDSSVMEEEQPWTFIYVQDNPQLTSTKPVFKSHGFSFSFVPCYQPQNFEPIWVVRTFNDLVLCCEGQFDQSVYYICNPITTQFVALPPAPPIYQERDTFCVDFICDPYYQKHQNPYQDDEIDVVLNAQYRFWVMRVEKFVYTADSNLTLQIFSSETGRWEEHLVPIPKGFLNEFKHYSYCVKSLAIHGNNIVITVIESDEFSIRPRTIKMSYPNNNKEQFPSLRAVLPKLEGEIDEWPQIKIWEFNENDCEWRLADQVYLGEIISLIDGMLKPWHRSFRHKLMWDFHTVALGLDPHNQNVMYLNTNFDRVGIVRFDTQSRTFVSVPNSYNGDIHEFLDFFQIVVPFWPTPMPQISSC